MLREIESGRRKANAASAWVLRLYIGIAGAAGSLVDERGQDLIEYSLVAALIALAATVGMKSVAASIAAAFVRLGAKLSGYTT